MTILNRGTHPAPSGTIQLTGDRLAPDGHAALVGKRFDAVLDTWQSDPIAVERALAVLRGNIGHYAYVSTISVYDDSQLADGQQLTEESPLVDLAKEGLLKYCADKRGAELALLEASPPIPLLIARPGLILGPEEGPMRLPWWLERLQRGGADARPGAARFRDTVCRLARPGRVPSRRGGEEAGRNLQHGQPAGADHHG